MKRLTLILAGSLACLMVAGVGLAAAAPTETAPTSPVTIRMCSTKSKNVITKAVPLTVSSKNVDPSQASYAKCPTAKKVAGKLLSLRIEEPKDVEGFRCTPRVVKTDPDVVNYNCLFRGADTATEIQLKFTAKYDLD